MQLCYNGYMAQIKIEYSGEYTTGSNLIRTIVYHYDKGERLLGMYEVWATKDLINKNFPSKDLDFDEKTRSNAIEAFEDMLKHNEKNNKNDTAVFLDVDKPPKYGNYREFPGSIADIESTVRTNVSMPENMYAWLRVQAAKENSNISEVIKQAVREYQTIVCPKCGSNHVVRTGFAHGVGATGLKLPPTIHKQYQCLDCKSLFHFPSMDRKNKRKSLRGRK